MPFGSESVMQNTLNTRYSLDQHRRTLILPATVKFTVTCPDCALESLSEMSLELVTDRLLNGKTLRLYSRCHDRYWTATFTERERLRKTLELNKANGPSNQSLSAAKLVFAP